MPLYDYSCSACGAKFERLIRRPSDVATVTCPMCDSQSVERQLSLPAAPVAASGTPASQACGAGPPCGAPWCKRTG